MIKNTKGTPIASKRNINEMNEYKYLIIVDCANIQHIKVVQRCRSIAEAEMLKRHFQKTEPFNHYRVVRLLK